MAELSAPGADALTREALRIYRRYQMEVVEALGLCPWAERARLEGHVRESVLLEPVPRVVPTLDALDALAEDEMVEIGLLIFPRVRIGRAPFEQFVASLRDADAKRRPGGGIVMATAAFHPEAQADLCTPARLVPFLRRSPDPTIQLVRMSVLERVRRNTAHGTGFVDPSMLDPRALSALSPPKPPLHERVAEMNLETVEREGVPRIEAILRDIERDRDESYARCR